VELSELKDRHAGETIWVLGSGRTLQHIDPAFFDDKTVVSTNYSAVKLGAKAGYVFSHYHADIQSMLEPSSVFVTLLRCTNTKDLWGLEIPDNLIFIEQNNYTGAGSSWNPFGDHQPLPHSLVYGSSSLHGAMHLAAHLGAKHIILVGADCGTLDGEHRIEGYKDGDKPWALYNQHHLMMKKWLKENYGCDVYSLNPFINFNLEGHTFEGV
jgi:hypothetical protein